MSHTTQILAQIRLILERYEQAKDAFLEIQSQTLQDVRLVVNGAGLEMDDDDSASVDHESIAFRTPLPSTSSTSVSSDSVISSVVRELADELRFVFFTFPEIS